MKAKKQQPKKILRVTKVTLKDIAALESLGYLVVLV